MKTEMKKDMKEDIIDILEVKEREMEALIEGARVRALEITEAAGDEAEGIKNAAAAEVDGELETIRE
ncbi:MAG: hypothetical protein V3W31_10345, partial [Thermodesulfobacteriota bacterium]